MVTVKDYHVREGERGSYVSLELMGDIELVQSTNTGRFYATARRCFVSSTFSENIAKLMVGRQMAGSINRVSCEPYEYTIPETGEVITMGYRWDYQPDDEPVNAKRSFGLVSA
jgi:hypothetical protein